MNLISCISDLCFPCQCNCFHLAPLLQILILEALSTCLPLILPIFYNICICYLPCVNLSVLLVVILAVFLCLAVNRFRWGFGSHYSIEWNDVHFLVLVLWVQILLRLKFVFLPSGVIKYQSNTRINFPHSLLLPSLSYSIYLLSFYPPTMRKGTSLILCLSLEMEDQVRSQQCHFTVKLIHFWNQPQIIQLDEVSFYSGCLSCLFRSQFV